MVLLYTLTLVLLSLYSYLLVPVGLYLSHNSVWVQFQRFMWSVGAARGSILATVYFMFIVLLFFFHTRFLRSAKTVSLRSLAIATGVVLFCSYPFLSQDVFNYHFYAKIFTEYHLNPFVHPPSEFSHDPFFRYVVLPNKTTFYGPSFVLLSAIPSFLSRGSFLTFYLLYKVMTIGFYLAGVVLLGKWRKEWAVFFATSPLVLIEGLINVHNDLIAVVITLAGMYYLFYGSPLKARALLVFSGLIKFITIPYIIIGKDKNSMWTWIATAGIAAIFIYATFLHGISTWYLLALFALIPYHYDLLRKLQIFYFGSLIGYVYYIEHREWFLAFFVQMMFGSLVINFVYNTTNGFSLRSRKKN